MIFSGLNQHFSEVCIGGGGSLVDELVAGDNLGIGIKDLSVDVSGGFRSAPDSNLLVVLIVSFPAGKIMLKSSDVVLLLQDLLLAHVVGLAFGVFI